MPEQKDTDRVTVAIVAPDGQFRQVVNCLRRDLEQQGIGWDGHEVVDVTDQQPDAHPRHHMLDMRTRKVIARVQPVEEARYEKLLELARHFAQAETEGFESSATGKTLRYAVGPQHHNAMQMRVHGGGDLTLHDGRRVHHTADQVKVIIGDCVAHQDGIGRKFQDLRGRLESCQELYEIASIQWDGDEKQQATKQRKT